MDLRMPEVDGMWALYRLRERGDTTPVVVLTGARQHPGRRDRDEAGRATS